MQRRIVPGYVRTLAGLFDLAVARHVPLLPDPRRVGRIRAPPPHPARAVARVLVATGGMRRLAERLGKVALVAGLVLFVCSLAAYEAEHPTNPEFATVGDAFRWGIVTLTTVGHGD